jgi:hypothetical protein
MLDLLSRDATNSESSFVDLLRGTTYSGAFTDGSPWLVATPLQRSQRAWGTYQRNEMLSLAVQALFAAVLRTIERDHDGKILRSADAEDIAVGLLSSAGGGLKRPLSEVVADVRANLPALTDWMNPQHELQRGWRILSLGLGDDQVEQVASESITILLTLLARGLNEYPYSDFQLDAENFDPREVHLLSLRQLSQRDWATMNFEEWIRWLSIHWGIERHLRVALRKLRGERRDTFRIQPRDGELRVIEVPKPTYTSPRVNQSIQILQDLGLVGTSGTGSLVLTPRGQQELEVCRGT